MFAFIVHGLRVVLLPFITALGVAAFLYQHDELSASYQQLLEDVVEVHFPSTELVERALDKTRRIQENFTVAAVASEGRFLYENDQLASDLQETLHLLQRLQPEGAKRDIQHIQLLFSRYYKTARGLAGELLRSDGAQEARRLKLLENVELLNNLMRSLEAFNSKAHDTLLAHIQNANALAAQQRDTAMKMGLLLAVILLLLCLAVIRPARQRPAVSQLQVLPE